MNPDDGYISEYLIHWTGKNGNDQAGARVLSVIAARCQLLLSYNVFHILDIYSKIHEKMVCFTDVPLSHAAQLCERFGHFGIAFHKINLMRVGTQPVFYSTVASKQDLDDIFGFLREQSQSPTIGAPILDALQRHFYFMQTFSEGRADKDDTYYYEREWRLGKQNLAPIELWKRPDKPHHHIIEAGYPHRCGKLFTKGNKEYFQFCKEDVAFLICPRAWKGRIVNPRNFPVHDYEDLVNE